MSQLRQANVIVFCVQLRKSEDRKRHWWERGCYLGIRERGKRWKIPYCIQKAMRFACLSWDVRFKNPNFIYSMQSCRKSVPLKKSHFGFLKTKSNNGKRTMYVIRRDLVISVNLKNFQTTAVVFIFLLKLHNFVV